MTMRTQTSYVVTCDHPDPACALPEPGLWFGTVQLAVQSWKGIFTDNGLAFCLLHAGEVCHECGTRDDLVEDDETGLAYCAEHHRPSHEAVPS